MFATFKIDFESRRKYITVSVLILTEFRIITLMSRFTSEQIVKSELLKTNHISSTGRPVTKFCWPFSQISLFSGACYTTDSDQNLIGLRWMEEIDLFTIPLNSIFNTFSISSVSNTKKYFTHAQCKLISVTFFKRTWSAAIRSKPASS